VWTLSSDSYIAHMPKSKPLSRLQQLSEHVGKMSGENLVPKFETLQLHAGTRIHVILQCDMEMECSS